LASHELGVKQLILQAQRIERVVRPEHYYLESKYILPSLLSAVVEYERLLSWAEVEYRRAVLHLGDLKQLTLDTIDAIQALDDGRKAANEAWLNWSQCFETYFDLWELSRVLSGHEKSYPPKRNAPPENPPIL
jgi:hypothetical protein